jgi:hypothetical protein
MDPLHLNNYSNISEVASKIPVYEDFKQQFVKFFKTNSTVIIDTDVATVSHQQITHIVIVLRIYIKVGKHLI